MFSFNYNQQTFSGNDKICPEEIDVVKILTKISSYKIFLIIEDIFRSVMNVSSKMRYISSCDHYYLP